MKILRNDTFWWIVIILIVTVVSLPLGQMLFHPSTEMPAPIGIQIPFFIILSIVESISLGVAVAFLILGKKLIDRSVEGSKKLAWAVYLSIAWLTGSWWIHDKLHSSNGMNIDGLLRIEYGFHITLIIAGFVLAFAFFHPLKSAVEKSI